MSRRRVVAIASAGVILLLGVVAVAAVASITQTRFGRSWVRRNAMALLNARLHGRGTIYLGAVSGSFLTNVVFDSVAVRDEEDSLFVAAGRVRLSYDPRDLIDRRLRITRLEMEHPFVNIRRHADDQWNFKRIFGQYAREEQGEDQRPGSAASQQRSFGDFVRIDSLILHDGTVLLTMPWHPDEWLHGARRDSAVAAELASAEHDVRRTSEGLKRTWRWTGLELRSPHVRLADPDSAGQLVVIGRARVREVDPPLDVHNMRGQVRILDDTAWIDLTHFDFPASTGHARGTIRWGGDLPTRYAVHIVGDSMSLRDVNWVYETLPTTGGGTMELDIHNDPRDLHVLQWALSKLDIRSTRSHLTGRMTFSTGQPVLGVTDVALNARPVNFDFLRTLHGGPYPVDWQGNITGTVRAPGGPLDHFQVDDFQFVFHDAHVPGAVSRGTAQGGLDIQFPARTVFHGFDVRFSTLDLRSIEYLFPNFPRLAGTVSGSAVLDSSWLDVRFHDADITHHDGAAEPTHVTGAGRVTYGPTFLTFDLDMQADPLSFTTLARSYPALRVRGPYVGPVRVKGTLEDLDVSGTLAGAAGTMAMTGHFDLFAPGYLARASGSVTDLDVSTLLDQPSLPSTQLTGSFTSDLRGDSLANLIGTLGIGTQRSRVDHTMISSSTARLAFSGGHLFVDSLDVDGDGVRLRASGALGLTPAVSDTLQYRLGVDWLGALRPYLPLDVAVRDSLDGRLSATGSLVGSTGHLATTGTLSGSNLAAGSATVRRLSGTYDFTGLPNAFAGAATASLDTITVGGIRIADVAARLAMPDRAHARVSLAATSARSDEWGSFQLASSMNLARGGDTLRVTIDTLDLTIGDHAWALGAPASIFVDSADVTVESLMLRNGAGGRFAMHGYFPDREAVSASLVADSVPLGDAGVLTQSTTPLGGFASMSVDVAGTRADPSIRLDGRFTGARFGGVHLPFFTVRGRYVDRRLDASARLYRDPAAPDGRPVLTATAVLPMDLSLRRVGSRMLTDPITGEVRADSVNLALLGTMSPELVKPKGLASAMVRIGGSWQHPMLSGEVMIRDGATELPRAGIGLRRVNADVAFVRDSIYLRRLSAVSGDDASDSISVTGVLQVPDYASLDDAAFDLTLNTRNFEAFDQGALSGLQLTGGVRLAGAFDDARLTGAMTIDRGTIYLPELGRKNVVALNESAPGFYDVVDTTFGRNRGIVPQMPPLMKEFMAHLQVPDLRIGIGDDVWLRSDEANIKLGGSVDLARVGDQRLSGTLQVVRGTYRLDLGLVQRTFQVDSGSVVFYGDPEIPPTLDVYATYTVRQVNRQDVHVIAHIGGTLANPSLDLTTTEQFALSPTEILSYLAFGAPTFALGGPSAASALRPVASALLPTIGGVIERALADQIGILDYVQVQTGSVGTDASSQTARDILSASRIGIGKQIGERTFVTANYGLCKFGGAQDQRLADALGVTVERRLDNGFSVQASAEPASTALLCGQSDVRDTPRQFGFDLFREWSF